MDFVLDFIVEYLTLYKYAILFLVTFFAAFALPIPSAATVIASGALAGQQYFHFSLVLLIGTLGNIAGDNTGYWLARLYGKKILYKIGLRKIIESRTFNAIQNHMQQKPGLIIFFSRFEVIATITVNSICGLGKISYKRYCSFQIIGEIVQVTMYASIGYFLGNNWTAINKIISGLSWLITIMVIVLTIFFSKKIIHRISKIQ